MKTIFDILFPAPEKKQQSVNDIVLEHVVNELLTPKKPQMTFKSTFMYMATKTTATNTTTCSRCPFRASCNPFICTRKPKIDMELVDLYKEFYDAIDILKAKKERDNYDFKLFGEPVKFYSNFVQVGYKCIPLHNENYFKTIDKPTRKVVIDIINLL